MAMNLKMSKCLQIVNDLPEHDQNDLLGRADKYMDDGVPASKAHSMAVKDMLAELRQDREDFHKLIAEQHPDLIAKEGEAQFSKDEEGSDSWLHDLVHGQNLEPLDGENPDKNAPRKWTDDERKAVRQMWIDYSAHADAFQHSTSTSKEMSEIAKATNENATVKDVTRMYTGSNLAPDEQLFRIGLPIEKNDKIITKDAYISVFHDSKVVEINVMGVGEGHGGSQIYNIAHNWAHNNGYQFNGDRKGISVPGMKRRTENMASQILKFGTSKFIAPHPTQRAYIAQETGVPMDWRQNGDTMHNLDETLQASYHLTTLDAPEIKNVTYWPRDHQFHRADGRVFTNDDFVSLANRLHNPALEEFREGSGGVASLKRAALTNTLLRTRTGSARTALVSHLKQIGLPSIPELKELQYSRTEEESSDRKESPFYSQLSKSIDSTPDRLLNKSGKEVSMWLDANASKLGVKKDEIYWTGLSDWVKTQPKVSKEQIQEFLKGNGVQVHETTLHESKSADEIVRSMEPIFDKHGYQLINDRGDILFKDENGDWVQEEDLPTNLRDAFQSNYGTAQYQDYQTPGGKNYKELLLTLPKTNGVKAESAISDGHNWDVKMADGTTISFPEKMADDKAEAFKYAENQRGTNFQSSHFDQPNILAHIRFNERTDSEGRKVLFLEELQSDWQQSKRKGNDVSDAPFIGDTKSVTALSLKRMIAYAVDHGFDRIAWTNGKQQAERYNLAKTISEIKVSGINTYDHSSVTPTGTDYKVQAFNHNGFDVVNKRISNLSELDDIIGKDAADKARTQIESEGKASLKGLDLQVGGEGMHSYYDQIVPQVANDILKKSGGKVGDVSMNTSSDRYSHMFDIYRKGSNESYAGPFDSIAEAKKYMESPSDEIRQIGESKQQGFDITPALKEKVSTEGLPLFSRNEPVNESEKELEMHDNNSGFKMPGRELASNVKDATTKTIDSVLSVTSPLSLGSDRARAIEFDFAAAQRKADYDWELLDKKLVENFTPEELKQMFEAGHETNELLLRGESIEGKGVNALPEKMKAIMDWLNAHAQALFKEAQKLGMVEGADVLYWVPRTAINIKGDTVTSVGSHEFDVNTGGIRTNSQNLKFRKHETLDESEAALKAKFGEDAQYVRDIRAMPLAMQKLQRAIAGRRLINEIKKAGKDQGEELVAEGKADDPQYFTIPENPAFYTKQVRMLKENGELKLDEYGKPQIVKDQDGKPVVDRVPIYIRKEFEGPLKSIMTEKNPEWYKALMGIKGAAMSAIMFSPFTHLMTEIGRAAPILKHRIVAVWFVGNRAKNDPTTMRQAISDGVVRIHGSQGMPELTGMVSGDDLQPGKAWATRAVGNVIGKVNKSAGEGFKKGADAFGNFWHGTLLWDRIGDLQMGIYTYYKADLMKKGFNASTAGVMAAHFANRYAGAIKPESVPGWAGKVANLVMFSKSFTLGNLGAMKDSLTGLPKDVKSKILVDAQKAQMALGKSAEDASTQASATLKSATKVGRYKSAEALIVDIGMMVAITSLGQSAMNYLRGTTDDENEKTFLDRLGALGHKLKDKPYDTLNHPLDALMSLSSSGDNEPGKENRILIGHDKDGTAEYARLSFGKIGEEMTGWMEHPVDKAGSKLSTLAKPLVQIATNDAGFGRPVFDPDATGISGAVTHLGNAAMLLMKSQIPADLIKAANDWHNGNATEVDKLKLEMSILGVPISKGATGGELMGEYRAEEKRYKATKDYHMPDVNQALKEGNTDKAYQIMTDVIGMTPKEANMKINSYGNVRTVPTKSMRKEMLKNGTEEEKSRAGMY